MEANKDKAGNSVQLRPLGLRLRLKPLLWRRWKSQSEALSTKSQSRWCLKVVSIERLHGCMVWFCTYIACMRTTHCNGPYIALHHTRYTSIILQYITSHHITLRYIGTIQYIYIYIYIYSYILRYIHTLLRYLQSHTMPVKNMTLRYITSSTCTRRGGSCHIYYKSFFSLFSRAPARLMRACFVRTCCNVFVSYHWSWQPETHGAMQHQAKLCPKVS